MLKLVVPMNKLKINLFLIFFLLFCQSSTQAIEDKLADDVIILKESQDIEKKSDTTKFESLKLGIQKTFEEPKVIKFDNRYINEISSEMRFQGITSFEDSENDFDTTFPMKANLILNAKFLDNKYRFQSSFSFARNVDDLEHKFFGKFSSLYIERELNKNNAIRLGTSRVPLGVEGSISPYFYQFANGSQISRNYSNITSQGISLIGEYKQFDYNLGAWSGTRNTQGLNDGIDFIGRIGFQPFKEQEEHILKNLKISASSDIGHSKGDYQVYGGALEYNYKKFFANAEYMYANGSNRNSYNPQKGEGFFITAGWDLTPKLQILGRYDFFDPDKHQKGDVSQEYTIGFNYFMFKEKVRLGLNYVFCDYQNNKPHKNAIYLITHFFI